MWYKKTIIYGGGQCFPTGAKENKKDEDQENGKIKGR
jgi:hypothetical protein